MERQSWMKHGCLLLKCLLVYHTTTTPQPFYGPIFRDHPGEPVPEELLDFMVQWKINRCRHTDHPAGRHSIWTNQCPPPPSPIFYRPDALPAAQPTVSKHCWCTVFKNLVSLSRQPHQQNLRCPVYLITPKHLKKRH